MPVFKRTKRTPYAKRVRRSKRTYRKRTPTTLSNIRNDTYAFKRSFLPATIVGNPVFLPYLAGISFSLNQLPSVAEFSNLFDRYMITYVKMYVHLKVDPSAQVAANATLPKLYWIKDFDDAGTPSSINELREHSKCQYRVMNPNKPIVIGIKPSSLSLGYRSALTNTFTPEWRRWIDMATIDVPHYGFKIAIDDLTNTNYKVDFEYKMWFKCKDTR